MSRTEGTPVDEANMVVSRRERNVLNIQELESEITASGKVTAEDLELLAVLKRADSDKNGVVSAIASIFRDDAKVRPRVLVHCMTHLPLSPSDPSVVAITL